MRRAHGGPVTARNPSALWSFPSNRGRTGFAGGSFDTTSAPSVPRRLRMTWVSLVFWRHVRVVTPASVSLHQGTPHAPTAEDRRPAPRGRVRLRLAAAQGDGAHRRSHRARLDLAWRPP